jgi:hypothetical protein
MQKDPDKIENQHDEDMGLFKGSNKGAWRESFVVDVLEIDGKKFMKSLTSKEMPSSIYTKALGLRPENHHGLVPCCTMLQRTPNNQVPSQRKNQH